MSNPKVACIDCRHSTIRERAWRCLTRTESFHDPIFGKTIILGKAALLNEDGDCKSFEQFPLWIRILKRRIW